MDETDLDNNSFLGYNKITPSYQIVYYQTARGEAVVRDFLLSLDRKIRVKVNALLVILEEQGPDLKRPYADVVRGKIRELRVQFGRNQIRILYFFFHKRQIVLLDGFRKKEWAIRSMDLYRSEQRMNDWIARHP